MREAKIAAGVISVITACLFGGGAVAINATPQSSTRDNFEIVEPAYNVVTLTAETSVKTETNSKKEAEKTNETNVAPQETVNKQEVKATNISYIADRYDDAASALTTVLFDTTDVIEDEMLKLEELAAATTTTTTTTKAATTTTTKATTTTTAATTVEVTVMVTEAATEDNSEEITEETDSEASDEASSETEEKENTTDKEEEEDKENTSEKETASKADAEKETKEDNDKKTDKTDDADGNEKEDVLDEEAAEDENSLPISEKDYILLCNAVGHEAGSDWISQKDKACVVEVIMNRVKSSKYPNSVYGVLTQKYQFSGSSAYVDLDDFSGRVTEDVKKAVLLYFNDTESFDHGYLFFSGDGRKNYFY